MIYHIYKVKEGTDLNEFAKNGYDIIPSSKYTIVKAVELPFDCDLVQSKLNGIYANPEWKKQFYDKNKKLFRNTLRLKYHKNGEIILTKAFKQMLTTWIIEIDFGDDGWVGCTTVDANDHNVYYVKDMLDKHFKEEINKLKELNLIEEIEIEQ